jgi:hypothetical protein
MEKLKYLDPKYMPTLYPLMKFLKTKYGGFGSDDSDNENNLLQASSFKGLPNNYSLKDDVSLSSLMSQSDSTARSHLSKMKLTSFKIPEQFSMEEQDHEEDDETDKEKINITPGIKSKDKPKQKSKFHKE